MENCTKERQETLEKIARQVLTAAPVFKKKLFRPDIEQKDNPIPLSYVQVLAALDGSTPVLAAVKPKDTDFLRRVRQHPHGEVFNITPESREALYQHLRSRILQWNKEEL